MSHATPQVSSPTRTFTQLLSSTRRGARLARLLAVTELRSWGAPPDLTERAEAIVAELGANDPGRDGHWLLRAGAGAAPCGRPAAPSYGSRPRPP